MFSFFLCHFSVTLGSHQPFQRVLTDVRLLTPSKCLVGKKGDEIANLFRRKKSSVGPETTLLMHCYTSVTHTTSVPAAETRRERELGGCGPEPAVPPRQDTLPALHTSGLEPQRLDGPQSGGVRLLLQ